MDFEWHDEKSDRCLRERGFDFGYATRIFAGRLHLEQACDGQDGEKRTKAVGEVEGRFYVVIFTDREDVLRIISARRARKEEIELWHSFGSLQQRLGLPGKPT